MPTADNSPASSASPAPCQTSHRLWPGTAAGNQCIRFTEGYAGGPLERTALRRGRYREAVNWSVLAAAAFNLCSVISLGSYALRGKPPWRELYYISTAVCVAYTLASLWSRREQPGEQFKAFVLQEGFVYSCMLEMFTWTWISIVFTLAFVIVAWGSLLFHFSVSSLPGSRQYLWSFAYLVNFPTFLRLDPVTSTATFKSAAITKGYPGVAFTHVGFLYRFVLSAGSCPLFLLAWLLVCSPDGMFLQSEYDMYFLYGQAAVLTALLLLVWLPRYANTVKSREVLEGQFEMANPSSFRSSPSLRLRLRSVLWGQPMLESVTAAVDESPTAGMSSCTTDEDGASPPCTAGYAGWRVPRVELAIDMTGVTDYTLPNSVLSNSNGAANDSRAMPLPGSSACISVGCVVPPNESSSSTNTPSPQSPGTVTPRGRSYSGEPTELRQPPFTAWPSDWGTSTPSATESSTQLVRKSYNGPPSLMSTSSALDGIASSRSFGKSVPRRSSTSNTLPCIPANSVSSTGIPEQHYGNEILSRQRATSRLSSTRFFRPSGTGATDEHGRSFRDYFAESSTSRSEHVFARSLGERPRMKNEGACFGERARDELTADVAQTMEILGYIGSGGTSSRDDPNQAEGEVEDDDSESSPINQYISYAMRATSSPLRMLVGGLWGLPHGTYTLIINVTAAIQHFKDNWRWWAATKTDKFLVTTGYLVVGMFAYPTVELPITSSIPAAISSGLALVWVLALNSLILFGKYSRASEAMILAEVRKGGNIGSGLVFSTASILNALTFDEPVEQGFVATEGQLVHTAVISCRWDTDASWELEVCEGGGRTRMCRVMFPRVQLYRAALAARARGCDCMWVDCMSVPQISPSDPSDVVEAKTAAIRRLIPTMTAVYASAQLVLVLETACGQEDGPDAYSKRTWTLQECVINQCTELVHLDGRHTVLGDAASRRTLSGLTDDELADGMDDLASYKWVLEGEERAAAAETSPAQRESFSTFADSRTAWRAADKAVALGQIFFRVLFEHVDVATEFIMEVATLLAKESKEAVVLIDNTGWDEYGMTGSACKTRYLMGKPSVMEAGPPAMWHIRRVRHSVSNVAAWDCRVSAHNSRTADSASSFMGHDRPCSGGISAMLFGSDRELDDTWWLCEIMLQDERVPVAVLPGEMHAGGHVGHLRKLRTCSAEERAIIRSAKDLESTKVLWM